MELKVNQVVKLRNGKVGVVSGFNNKPCLVVFENYTSQLSRYDENLKHKKSNDYDIVEVYEGKKVEKFTDVYRKKFDLSTLKEVYKAEE
jgi:predicted RNA methylase